MTTPPRTPLFASAPRPNPRAGFYEIDGEKYARVSRVLDVIAKPSLAMWRMRVFRAALEGGMSPDLAAGEADRIAREAANRGTAVHKLCEDVDLGRKTACPDPLRPFLTTYLAWKDANVRTVEMVERTVHSQRFKVAGTLDRVFTLKSGMRVLADLKTGRSVDAIYRLQQAAYAEMLEEMDGAGVDGRLILHLPSSRPGCLRVVDYDADDGAWERDRRAWRAAVRLFRWTEKTRNEWKVGRNGKPD